MSKERLQHMVMPTLPGTCFVMVQSNFSLPFLQCCFHGPPHPGDARQFLPRAVCRRIAQGKLGFGLRVKRTTEDCPTAWPGQLGLHRCDAHKSQLDHQRTFAAFFDLSAMPGRPWQLGEERTQLQWPRRCEFYTRIQARSSGSARSGRFHGWRPQPNARVGRYFGQIPLVQCVDFMQKRTL